MSKRKRKRNNRSHRKTSQPTASRSADVLQGPGFRMERRGRFIHTTTHRTNEEQQALIEKMAASVDDLSSDLSRRAAAIESRIREHDTFTILGALALQNHVVDPETYKEYSHPGKSFVSEYASLLALKYPYSVGTKEFVDLSVLHELQEEIEGLFMALTWLYIGRYARRKIAAGAALSSSTALEDMQFSMWMHELAVRNPAYEHHHHSVLRDLFQSFEKDLLDLIGFTIDDALSMSDAITTRMSRLFLERLQKSRKNLIDTKENIRKARRAGPDAVVKAADIREFTANVEYYRELLKRSPNEVDRFLKTAALAWLFVGADSICSFTAKELAHEAGVSSERAEAYAALFSMTFGDVPPEFIEPSPTHPLRNRPLVRHEDRYLSSAPMLLDWAIQPAFEAAFKTAGASSWQRFQKHRHDHVLRLSAELLQRMMPAATIDTNLLYCEGENPSREAEIDAIAIYDSVVFLIEVKGADVTDPARRGAPDRLRRDLEEVIAKSHSQALRAKDYISAKGHATFRRAAGGPDLVIPGGIQNVVMISVSLAPLGHLTALLHAGSDIGFFRDGEYSWVVSLYDLIVLGDVIDLPPMFPHYVMRRVHTAHQGVLEAHDELDIFGYYLKEGLYIDDIAEQLATGEGKATMGLLSYTGQFDEYYAYITGSRRKRAEKPAQRMHPKLRGILDRLEASGLLGRVDAAMAILDLCHETRMVFLKGVEKAQKICSRNRKPSNFTLTGKDGGGWGLTYMCDREPSVLSEDDLRHHCNGKQQQSQYKKWVGIAEVIGNSPKTISVSFS